MLVYLKALFPGKITKGHVGCFRGIRSHSDRAGSFELWETARLAIRGRVRSTGV